MERTKRRLDENITRKHPIYKAGDLVKTLKNTKKNKLEPAWKGPFGLLDYIENNNLRIRNEDKIILIHIDQCMPYFTDPDTDFLLHRGIFIPVTSGHITIPFKESDIDLACENDIEQGRISEPLFLSGNKCELHNNYDSLYL